MSSPFVRQRRGRPGAASARSAFTLLEVIIIILIVLMMMLLFVGAIVQRSAKRKAAELQKRIMATPQAHAKPTPLPIVTDHYRTQPSPDQQSPAPATPPPATPEAKPGTAPTEPAPPEPVPGIKLRGGLDSRPAPAQPQ